MQEKTRYIAVSGLFIALGLVLPFFTAQIPAVGRALLPMHIPVLLAGFIVGWPSGLIVGLVTPLLRSVLFGAPPFFPSALAMTFELGAYGFLAGFLYRLLPPKRGSILAALIGSMLGGRIVWGITTLLLLGLSGSSFTWQAFVAGAVVNAVPGIVLQIVLIPAIVLAFSRGKYV